MSKNVVFDEASAARIAAAVRWVEQFSLDETPDPDDPLPPDANDPVTVCRELSKVVPTGNITLLSQINPTGTVVTGVACVNGNLTVTTASLFSLVGYTEKTVRLSDLAAVTTQNLTLPKQEGCS
jgi:hypothetical protein